MTSRPTSVIPSPTPPSATAGSPATSRPATSNGRSLSCNSSTPTLKSSPMSPQDSTTAERDLQPYWNDFIEAISSHLWLPTETGSPGSAPNSSSKCSSKTVANSWFSTSEISAPQRNSPRIYSPSLLSSLPEPTDSAGTGRKSRKIRIYPDRQQKAKLKLWFDAARFTYNHTIELLNSDGAPKASWLGVKKDILTRLPDWTKPVPYEVKSNAVRDACLAVSAVKKFNKQLKADKDKWFRQEEDFAKAHFRSRRDDSQTIFIHASALSHRGVYHTLLGELKKKGTNSPRPRRCQAHTEAPPIPPERALQEDGTPHQREQPEAPSTRPGEGGGAGPGSEELHHLVLRGRLRKTRRTGFRTNPEAVPAPGQSPVPCYAGAVKETAQHAQGRRKNDRQDSEPDKRTPPQNRPVPGRQLRRHTAA